MPLKNQELTAESTTYFNLLNNNAMEPGSNHRESENNVTTDYLQDQIQVHSQTGLSNTNSNNYISIYDHPANERLTGRFEPASQGRFEPNS